MNKRTVPMFDVGLRLAFWVSAPLAIALLMPASAPAQSIDARSTTAACAGVPAPYDKLSLSPDQVDQIHSLDLDWQSHFAQIRPHLKNAQERLASLLSSPKSDPFEITSEQQRINSLKNQLNEQATANYLRKRRLLNSEQRVQLNGYLRRMVANRQQRRL